MQLGRLAGCIDRGLDQVRDEQVTIRAYVEEAGEVAATLDPKQGNELQRKEKFAKLTTRFQRSHDPIHRSRPFPAGLGIPEIVRNRLLMGHGW